MIVDIFWILLIIEVPSIFLGGLLGLAIKKVLTVRNVLLGLLVSIPISIVLSILISLVLLILGLATRIVLWPLQ